MKSLFLKIILSLQLPDLWGGNINKGNPDLEDLSQLIRNIANIAIALVGTVALLFLIIGGFYYITSAGNPDNVGKAKQTILYSIIGLILAIVSYAIINFIINKIQ